MVTNCELNIFLPNPLTKEEFSAFLNCFEVNGRWFYDDKALFSDSMTALSKTPTGCLFMRRILENVSKKQQEDPRYRIQIDFSRKTGDLMGSYQPRQGGILIFANAIQKRCEEIGQMQGILPDSEMSQQAFNEIVGIQIAHELSHLDQDRNGLLEQLACSKDPILSRYHFLYAEAEPRALEHQLALENSNLIVRSFFDVSGPARAEYLHQILNKKQNPETLSLKNQALFARDFLSPLDEAVYTDYSSISERFSYMNQTGVLSKLVEEKIADPLGVFQNGGQEIDLGLRQQVRDRYRSVYGKFGADFVCFKDIVPTPLIDTLAQRAKVGREQGKKATDSPSYQKAVQELEKCLYFIDGASVPVQEGRQEYQEISTEQRKILKEMFHIDLKEKNKKGERIATYSSCMTDRLKEGAETVPFLSENETSFFIQNKQGRA